MRIILLLTGIFLSTITYAQVSEYSLKEVEEKSLKFLNEFDSNEFPETHLDLILQHFYDLETVWNNAYNAGNLADKKVILYYSAIVHYNFGNVYFRLDSMKNAYTYWNSLADELVYILTPGWFPLEYNVGEFHYTVHRALINKIVNGFYGRFTYVCYQLHKWDDVIKYSDLALKQDSVTVSDKINNYSIMIAAKVNKGELGTALLKNLISLMLIAHKTDSAFRKTHSINENKIYTDVKNLADTLSRKDDHGLSYGLVAEALWDMGRYTEAEKYYQVVSQKVNDYKTSPAGLNEIFFQHAARTATWVGNKPLAEWAVKILESVPYYYKNISDLYVAEDIYKYLGKISEAKKIRRKIEQLKKK